MNVIYLTKEELPVIKEVDMGRLNLSKIFSSKKQGCIFVINEQEQLLGYLDDFTYRKMIVSNIVTYNANVETIIADTDSEIIGLEKKIKENLNCSILAIVDRKGQFKGAYIRTYPEELVSYDRLMSQVALASLPAFVDEFISFIRDEGYSQIIVIGELDDRECIIKVLADKVNIAIYKGYDIKLDCKSTLIIDLVYSKSYRSKELSQWLRATITKLDEILAASLVDVVIEHIKERRGKLFFIEGPMKEKIDKACELWPSLFNNSSLISCISDNSLLLDFCNGNIDLVKWMRDSEHGVLAGARITTNGIHLMTADYVSKECTCLDGVRIGKPTEDILPSIHMYGPCLTFGSCVPNKNTIQYYLNKLLAENHICYNIVNHGVKNGHSNLNDFLYIFNTELREGDIVICLNTFNPLVVKQISKHMDIHCSSSYLNKCCCKDIKFLDKSFHINSVGNMLLSSFIYEVIGNKICKLDNLSTKKNKTFLIETKKIRLIDSTTILSKGMLRSYVEYLNMNKKKVHKGCVIGSVIITANPITKGHEYLINYAKKNCDILYVFIVEEDSFFFSTAERMILVKEIIKDPNIIIVTTGSLMTAKFTFPEYFTKDKIKRQESAYLMPQLHFQIFGGIVAPLLGITKRFVGTEIPGTVTDVYNEKLKQILPSYGIEIIVIKRLESKDGEVVSASETRRIIEAGEFNKLNKYLSDPIIKYIKKKWNVK